VAAWAASAAACRSATVRGAGAGGSAGSAAAAGRAGAGAGAFGGAGRAGAAGAATPSASSAAFTLRATGGATLEDGPLTNWPIFSSFSSTTLLSMPSSAAISCTRGFATSSPVCARPVSARQGQAFSGRHSFRGAHQLSMGQSACSSWIPEGGSVRASSLSRSGTASVRSARPKARRRTARSTQSRVGCTHAPRPGAEPEGSGTSPSPPATTLSRAERSSRARQPRQVRRGSILPRLSFLHRATIHRGVRSRLRRAGQSFRIESGWMSIRAPVSFAARRAFWPSLPMASES
jgi:hypothetical protein